jgi:hypothetical protein
MGRGTHGARTLCVARITREGSWSATNATLSLSAAGDNERPTLPAPRSEKPKAPPSAKPQRNAAAAWGGSGPNNGGSSTGFLPGTVAPPIPKAPKGNEAPRAPKTKKPEDLRPVGARQGAR